MLLNSIKIMFTGRPSVLTTCPRIEVGVAVSGGTVSYEATAAAVPTAVPCASQIRGVLWASNGTEIARRDRQAVRTLQLSSGMILARRISDMVDLLSVGVEKRVA